MFAQPTQNKCANLEWKTAMDSFKRTFIEELALSDSLKERGDAFRAHPKGFNRQCKAKLKSDHRGAFRVWATAVFLTGPYSSRSSVTASPTQMIVSNSVTQSRHRVISLGVDVRL